MQRDILHLYQRAQAGPLEAKEVHWLESQVNDFPYFALPRIILARHNFQREKNVQDRRLQEGAAYSLDRGLFRNYLYMSLPEGSVAVREPVSISGSSSGGTPVAETKEVASDTEAKDEKPKDDPFAAGKINWFLNTRVQMRTNRYLGYYGKIKGGLFAPELVDKANTEASQPKVEAKATISPEKVVAEEKEAVAPEAPKVETKATVNPEKVVADAKDAVAPEAPKVEAKATISPEKVIADAKDAVAPEAPMVEAKATVNPEKVVADAKDAVAPEAPKVEAKAIADKEELVIDPKDTANPEPLVPKGKVNTEQSNSEAKEPVFHLEPKTDAVPIEIDIQPPATEESKESTPAKEAISAKASAAASEAKAAPKKLVSKEEKARAVEALLASRRAKEAKSADKEQTKEEKAAEYEIGSFSSFSFADDVDPGDGGEGEANTLVGVGETVSLQTPDNPEGGYSELVIENDDRRLEILVTPEELEKYFKGKLPTLTSETSGGDRDLMHLQFNFSVTEKGFGNAKPESEESVLEVQDLKATSSPEVISIVPTETELQDEERGQELIDKFIEHEPSITRGGHTKAKVGDLAKESVKDEDDWVTETLAKVYAMQGNNARAIRIYKKLTLIFPEKRAYFDVLIQKLKR